MKIFPLKQICCLTIFVLCISFFESCKKTDNTNIAQTPSGHLLHKYGLNAMADNEWSGMRVFPDDALAEKAVATVALPSNYLLTTPAVRDQGQIGSCTGFCGSETNEILHYYRSVSGITSPAITVANSVSTAVSNKFTSPTTYFGVDGALSPLFLYYVERVIIERKSITTDPGANMVNIGEVLQGLSSNGGSGSALTLSGNTFKGQCTEDLYTYPTTAITQSSPYNLASSSSTQFKTAPTSAAIANAPNFDIATQSGSTGTTGAVTLHGYYLINSTGDTNEVNNVKLAIVNNKPVMMGFNVYDNSSYSVFEDLSTASYIYNPLEAKTTTSRGVTTTSYVLNTSLKLLGGHAVPLVGFVNDGTASTSATGGGYFIVQNSWGTPWGYNGMFLLPYSVLRSSSVVPSGSLYVAIL
jgi:hypothetical protein